MSCQTVLYNHSLVMLNQPRGSMQCAAHAFNPLLMQQQGCTAACMAVTSSFHGTPHVPYKTAAAQPLLRAQTPETQPAITCLDALALPVLCISTRLSQPTTCLP